MSLSRFQLPYLTTAQRELIVISDRDLVFDTDMHQIFIGDGITLGGINAGTLDETARIHVGTTAPADTTKLWLDTN